MTSARAARPSRAPSAPTTAPGSRASAARSVQRPGIDPHQRLDRPGYRPTMPNTGSAAAAHCACVCGRLTAPTGSRRVGDHLDRAAGDMADRAAGELERLRVAAASGRVVAVDVERARPTSSARVQHRRDRRRRGQQEGGLEASGRADRGFAVARRRDESEAVGPGEHVDPAAPSPGRPPPMSTPPVRPACGRPSEAATADQRRPPPTASVSPP